MKTILLFIVVFCVNYSFSQNLHISGKVGLGSYKGDLKPSGGLGQSSLAWGLGVRYDISEHIIGRLFYNRTKLRADDAVKNNPRNLNFQAKLNEVTLGAQYQVFSLNDKWWTPYAFVGLSVFSAKPYTTYNGTKIMLQPLSTEGQGFAPGKAGYKTTNIGLEYGIGGEYALGEDLRVGLEAGFRITGTDYIDDVSSTYASASSILTNRGATALALAYRGSGTYPATGVQRGTSSKKDKFYLIQATVTYRPVLDSYKRMNGLASFKKNKKVGCPQTKGIF